MFPTRVGGSRKRAMRWRCPETGPVGTGPAALPRSRGAGRHCRRSGPATRLVLGAAAGRLTRTDPRHLFLMVVSSRAAAVPLKPGDSALYLLASSHCDFIVSPRCFSRHENDAQHRRRHSRGGQVHCGRTRSLGWRRAVRPGATWIAPGTSRVAHPHGISRVQGIGRQHRSDSRSCQAT